MKLGMEMYAKIYKEDGFSYALGKIYIGDDFSETIAPALNYWTMDDYRKQWKEGLERIKNYNTSCLVASIQNPETSNRLLNWWPIYKVGQKIYIQNELYMEEDYDQLMGDMLFTPETCYDFIRPRVISSPEGDEYSEWVIDLE